MAPLNRNSKNEKNENSRIAAGSKINTQTLLDFDLGESSSDSDFRIEDHEESDEDFSDADDDDNDSGDDNSDGDDQSESDNDNIIKLLNKNDKINSSNSVKKDKTDIKDILSKIASGNAINPQKIFIKPICCVCLGDRSDDSNEIVECDGCDVTVHEGCYGISDTCSISTTVSSCSTEPWFCEACRAGVKEPICEICPNKGGIFKETDVGKWVHLVCALYVPGVAFGEVEHLSSVTLFEMPYNKWGSKACSLCEDEKFARTGVCIGCDAGMCKIYFHVTCAQAAGFLSEAHSDEADHADPFYAHCKVHSDKTMIKHRKRNFNAFKMSMQQKALENMEKEKQLSAEEKRIERKLLKYQTKYRSNKAHKIAPWVPTQKISRLLTTSATACKRLMSKADVLGIDTARLELQELQMTALADIKKKWHIPPTFSVEFIGYYLDRISRAQDLKTNLEKFVGDNENLLYEQKTLRDEYDLKIQKNSELVVKNSNLKESISELHKKILNFQPNKQLPSIENIGRPRITINAIEIDQMRRPMSVPTAAALKMGVGFPLTKDGNTDDTGRILSTQSQQNELLHDCGICKRCHDQHLLAKCDICTLHYHLGCLNPPLQRHPKKSKLYGWQCSECDKSDDSDAVIEIPKGPRKSRTRFSKDGTIIPAVDCSTTNQNDSTVDTLSKRKISLNRRNSFNSTKTIINSDPATPEKNKISCPESINFNGRISQPHSIKSPTHTNEILKTKKPLVKVHRNLPASTKNSLNSFDSNKSDESDKFTNTLTPPLKKRRKSEKITDKMELIENKAPASSVNDSDSEGLIINDNSKSLKNLDKKIAIENSLAHKINCVNNCEKLTGPNYVHSADTDPLEIDPLGISSKKDEEMILHKQRRKRRKEKHKNKNHSLDSEKSSTKERKHKRKKKSHDTENTLPSKSSVPRIKIKFKTLPLPGEIAPEPQFFYVSADMVRPTDGSRPTSVETVDDSTDDLLIVTSPFSGGDDKFLNSTKSPKKTSTPNSSKLIEPTSKKFSSRRRSSKRASTNSNASSTTAGLSLPIGNLLCDVCGEKTNQNSVQCDDCAKNYHYYCLDPPLKKTPKRRGYSWHCADCDPTDNEALMK